MYNDKIEFLTLKIFFRRRRPFISLKNVKQIRMESHWKNWTQIFFDNVDSDSVDNAASFDQNKPVILDFPKYENDIEEKIFFKIPPDIRDLNQDVSKELSINLIIIRY